MSSHKNHRRGQENIQDHGPTWEGQPPASGCNSTHVARARKKWKALERRSERRNGKVSPKVHGGRHDPLPSTDPDEG